MQEKTKAITLIADAAEAIPTSSALVLPITRSITIYETNVAARVTRERKRRRCSLGVSLPLVKNGKDGGCSRAMMPTRSDWCGLGEVIGDRRHLRCRTESTRR